jgi:hypothetical protein
MNNPYKTLVEGSFSIDLNANDFFAYACSWSLTINSSDTGWIIPFIETHENVGLDVVMCYIQNKKPIPPYETEEFNLAMQDLIELNPTVYSDWDYGQFYSEDGPYRKISKE